MCAGLTSKWYLGVALCAAACGGCGSNDRPTSSAAPVGPTALADANVPAVAVLSARAGPVVQAAPVSQADVITWVNSGTSDDVIVDRLQHAPNVVHLTAGDEIKLRDAGVDDDVIRALKATAWN